MRHAGTLTVCAVRYALGRRTYIVSDVCSAVRETWPQLEAQDRAVIRRDVNRAIDEHHHDFGRSLGDACDVDAWQALAGWIADHW